MGMPSAMIDFVLWYIAEVNKSWTPLGTWGVLLHILGDMVSQRGLLAAFGRQTLVLGGWGLFFEEDGLCEAWYVSKIRKVHTLRIQQIVFLNAWHLSRTLTQRLLMAFPNNLSKMTSILISKCGGAQASGWGDICLWRLT